PPPRMRDGSPGKMGAANQTQGTRPDGRRPATAPRRPAIQYSGGIAISPARIPGPLTASGLVGSARIAVATHFARECGAFTTYRRTSFSPASTISGCIAAPGGQRPIVTYPS